MIYIDKAAETQNIILTLSQTSIADSFTLEVTHQFTGEAYQIPLNNNLSKYRDRYDDFLIETPEIPNGIYKAVVLDGEEIVYSSMMKVISPETDIDNFVAPKTENEPFKVYRPQ